jgi:hypothetical protein
MERWKAFCHTIHLVALGLWVGVLLSAGAFAASVFPIMKGLDPRLPAFDKYTGEHWLIAGGKVAQRIFLITDIVQFVCAVLSIATLGCMIWLFGLPRRRPATIVRAIALGVALACAAGSIIIVAPQLNAALRLYWAAAEAGNLEAVAPHRAAVDQLHPLSSRLMGGTFVCVLIAFVAGAWSAARPWREEEAPVKSSRYEEPALLRGRRA